MFVYGGFEKMDLMIECCISINFYGMFFRVSDVIDIKFFKGL